MAHPTLKLTYFDIKARAEPIRLALTIGNVPFEDYRIQREQWPELKKSCPFGQVPILEVDGKTVLAQSYAILRYAGSLAGLLPTDPLEAARVDEVLYLLTELDTLLAPSGKEADAEKKKALRQALAAGPLTTWFASLTKLLETSGSGFIVGKQLSIADLATYCRLQSFVGGKYDDIPPNIVDGYPLLKRLYEGVEAIPAVKAWNAAH